MPGNANRSTELHPSALSPTEYDAYAPWFARMEALQATSGRITHDALWAFLDRAVAPGQLDASREPEVSSSILSLYNGCIKELQDPWLL